MFICTLISMPFSCVKWLWNNTLIETLYQALKKKVNYYIRTSLGLQFWYILQIFSYGTHSDAPDWGDPDEKILLFDTHQEQMDSD